MNQGRGRIAYCTVPKIGGTFNFFRNLRAALAPLGWEVVSPVVGKYVNSLWDRAYPADGCVPVAAEEPDLKKASQSLVEWCLAEKIDVLIPMSVQAAVSAVPHLPPGVLPVMRCSNITRHAYDIVAVHLDRVRRVVATSQRQYDDLLRQRHVPKDKLVLIPHGIDTTRFEEAFRSRASSGGPVRIGYLGRLLDSAKGVFLLPKIADQLTAAGVPFHLSIIGDGPDRARLERRMWPHVSSGLVTFFGNRPHADIPGLLSQIDVLVMPSTFEGFGFSLIEAMAAGVVPVVSRIGGVTDWIVDDGRTGFVCPIGDARVFAQRMEQLARNRALLATMSHASHDTASARFCLRRLADDYAALFDSVLAEPGSCPPPLPWSEFVPSAAFEPTFRRWIPEGVKSRLRGILERWRRR